MNELFKIRSLVTKKVSIINESAPNDGERILASLNKTIEKKDNIYDCVLSFSIYKEHEKDCPDKTFSVEYVLDAELDYLGPEEQIDDFQSEVTVFLLPHIRAGVAGAMGAVGIDPIIVPYFQ